LIRTEGLGRQGFGRVCGRVADFSVRDLSFL
jgi:hypothetical protein